MTARLFHFPIRPRGLKEILGIVCWTAIVLASALAASTIVFLSLFFLSPRANNFDAAIYWSVGRGMLEGLRLYSDLFDLKPPGIFLLAAASHALFGSGILGNILGALMIVMLPGLATFLIWKKTAALPLRRRGLLMAIVFLGSALLTSYHAVRAEPWQTELFGGFAGSLYAMMLLMSAHPLSTRRMVLAGILILAAVGFKEPFLFVCIAVALLTTPEPRHLIRAFVFPALFAIGIGLMLLPLFGSVTDYVTLYLPAQTVFRVSWAGPLWLRGLQVVRVAQDLSLFSIVLPFFLAMAIAIAGIAAIIGMNPRATCLPTGRALDSSGESDHTFARRYTASEPLVRRSSRRSEGGWNNRRTITRTYLLGRLAVAIFLTILAVAIGGDFQGHHFAFATPAYLALLLTAALRTAKDERLMRLFAAPMLALLIPGILFLERGSYDRISFAQSPDEIDVRTTAAAIDTVLDRCGIGRYLFVYRNEGFPPYAYTRHNPLNHFLFAPIDTGVAYGARLANIAVDRLSVAQVLVVPIEGFTPVSPVGAYMKVYIDRMFSALSPPCAEPLPPLREYRFLFRTRPEALKLEVDFHF
ncbi:MAG: hypothetical protein Greene041619_399 [Candidatus Peregrinibacteria bacterium Greene0416_19]|nr:MAG: hypothetical protein Greene041619_399 [Candidatus Peregrinibacteria bacterium Greene0416_19]